MPAGTPSLVLLLRRETDPVLLPVFAQVWGVTDESLTGDALRQALMKAMLEPERADRVWDGLDEDARGALQMLTGVGGEMPETKFERLFGEIHEMGSDAIAREQPLVRARSIADSLYYRGLIHRRYEHASSGARSLIFVPDDLRGILPLHRTRYEKLDPADDLLPEADLDGEEADIETLDDVSDIRLADTSLVDDMTTLLAYARIHSPLLEGGFLDRADTLRLQPGLIAGDERRLFFLTALAQSAGLLDVQGGRAFPNRTEAQRWLKLTRPEQVKSLAEAWGSARLVDLLFVPGLYPEMQAGALSQYDPAAARAVVGDLMTSLLPQEGWWPRAEFVAAVKDENADFQRPNGDFDSWYIRDQSGTYLTGFESWDAVEGAMLEYLFTGPLHWLGLLDLAAGAARLTAYGRAFLHLAKWPSPPETPGRIEIAPDGTILASRKVSRAERYTVARIASWAAPASGSDAPYRYRIDAAAIQQAAAQQISPAQIASTLTQMTGGTLPAPLATLLDRLRHGPSAAVTLEPMLVLRATSRDILDSLYDNPSTRRYLGARLGETAGAVRRDQVDELRQALIEAGIQLDMLGD